MTSDDTSPARPSPARELSLPPDRLPDPLAVPPLAGPFDATIRPPGSKSITNRALLLAALAQGTSTLRGALVDADDAQVMIRALRQLGATVTLKEVPGAGPVTVLSTGWVLNIPNIVRR